MADQRIDATRGRLEQAHEHWHRALDSYPDVDSFVASVNALIPLLRSVTFVLQKGLAKVEGFDAWYEEQRDRMRADDVMRWLVEARNHIEKVGDLELRSTARAKVLADWRGSPGHEFDVPPQLSPSDIAVWLAAKSVPEALKEEGVLLVERRWVTASLPDQELLDACAHAYAVLNEIVGDAEHRFGGRSAPAKGTRLACMVVGSEARSAVLHLASGDLMAVERNPHRPTEADYARVEEKYGQVIRDLGKREDALEGRVSWQHRFARGMFLLDKRHRTIAFLFREGRPAGMVGMDAEDQQEKYVLMEALSKELLSTGADEVIITTEVWMAPLLPEGHPEAGLRPGQRTDRIEELATYGMDRAGHVCAFSSEISRDADEVRLADAEPSELQPQTLLPAWRAWHGDGVPPPWAAEGESTSG